MTYYDMTKGAINLTWRALFWDIPKMKEATKVGWREYLLTQAHPLSIAFINLKWQYFPCLRTIFKASH